MTDQTLNVKTHDVRVWDDGGAQATVIMSMGKNAQKEYNDGLFLKIDFSARDFPNGNVPNKGQYITVTCWGSGYDEWTTRDGQERKTPKFRATNWHPQVRQQHGHVTQPHPPASSYQNQWNVPF
jgi:hypothetical protein